MTSNLGNNRFEQKSKLGFADNAEHHEFKKDKVLDTIKKSFNPEFINRIDEIVYFHQLTKHDIINIVDIMLDELHERLQEQGIVVEFSRALKQHIAESGFDDTYGARFLRKTIQNKIEDALALEILNGNCKNCSKIKISVRAHTIVFKPVQSDKSSKDSGEKVKAGIQGGH
jgi:ATP-dependent Clp protease ATP-binding subunit ClpC